MSETIASEYKNELAKRRKRHDELREEYPFRFNSLSLNFNPKLSDEEMLFIYDVIDIGQRIKDRETFKKLLHHMFFKFKES